MPPLKRVGTLQDLTKAIIVQYIYSECTNIEEQFPSPFGQRLSFDTVGCKSAVGKLHELLSDFIAPGLWDSMFQSVIELNDKRGSVADERIIFATFLRHKVCLKKLKLKAFGNSPYLEPTHIDIMIFESRVKFWKERVTMLENLTEVDVSAICSDQIVQSLLKNCKNLQVVTLGSTSQANVECLLKSCKEVRMLSCDIQYPTRSSIREMNARILQELKHLEVVKVTYPFIATDLTSITRQLKLTSMSLFMKSPEDLDAVSDRCPHLRALRITGTQGVHGNQSDPILRKLSASNLQLASMSLNMDNSSVQALNEFIEMKGSFLRQVKIGFYSLNKSIYDFLEVLSKCKNLKKLDFSSLIYSRAVHSFVPNQITFEELTHISFDFIEYAPGSEAKEAILMYCLDFAVNLTSFECHIETYYARRRLAVEASLMEVFSHDRMQQLTTVSLLADRAPISRRLVRHLLKTCHKMTRLRVFGNVALLTEEERVYMEALKQEANCKNWDLILE